MNKMIKVISTSLLKIKRILAEGEYNPEYDKLPLRDIQTLLNKMEIEIIRLEQDVSKLENDKKMLNEELDRFKDNISEGI